MISPKVNTVKFDFAGSKYSFFYFYIYFKVVKFIINLNIEPHKIFYDL
jgi:hypothetical protein